tara:strand:+ start:1299 stop:1439 length:141 start_codon:yes stop_codon:yes gene_type:complete
MKLSRLEENGVKVQKIIPPTSAITEIKEDISEIKAMLITILEKLSK